MTLWSITRVIWAIASLLVYVYNIELLQDSNTPVWSFLVLLLLFLVCEILPIVALLDYSYLSMVGLEQVEYLWVREAETSSQSMIIDPLLTPEEASSRAVRWEDEAAADPLLQTTTENSPLDMS
jgi:hypothetical protein